jgi:hypothetical protein
MTARRAVLSLTISLAAVMFGAAGSAQAAGCDTWYGPGGNSSQAKSGEWGTASNWSTGAAPTPSVPACITVPGTYTVTLQPYPSTHYAGDIGGAAEDLTLGGSSGTQTLQLLGEGFGYEGDWYNQTGLGISFDMTIGAHGVLDLEATEANAENQTGEPQGGGAVLEQDTSGQGGHRLLNEGTILARSSSSHWTEGIASREFSNSGNVQLESGSLRIHNDEGETNSGTFSTAAGTKLTLVEMTSFVNSGSFANAGATIFDGYATHAKWVQGANALSGNAIELESGAGVEDSSSSGGGAFTFIGSGYLLGTIPKSQTITLTSAGGQDTVFLANDTLVNEGTLHLDVPAGSENNTNVEEGSLVNRGTVYGTVEGSKAKNVIDVALTNEPGGVVSASSGTLFDNRTLTNNSLVQVATGATLEIVATTFINGSAGVIAPQIAGASSFGLIKMYVRGTLEAGGTVAPTLVGGFTPSSGEEFNLFEGPVKGTFAAISGGFTGDYSHQTAENPYVGVVYGASPPTNTGPPAGTGPAPAPAPAPAKPLAKAKLAKVTVSAGRVTVKLSCPAGSLACGTTTVTVMVHVKKHGRTVAKQIVVASGTVSLKAGEKATLKLRINSAGKALLRKHHSLKALATLIQGRSKVASEKVTLKA